MANNEPRLLQALKDGDLDVEDLKGATIKEVLKQENNTIELIVEVKNKRYWWKLKFNFDIGEL